MSSGKESVSGLQGRKERKGKEKLTPILEHTIQRLSREDVVYPHHHVQAAVPITIVAPTSLSVSVLTVGIPQIAPQE